MLTKSNFPLPIRIKVTECRKTLPTPSLQDIFDDICKVFNKQPQELRAGSRINELFFLRCIYCYVANVLTNEGCSTIYKLIYKDHASYISTLRSARCLFSCSDSKFMIKWNKYVEESELWNKYFHYHLPNTIS